MKNKIKEIGKYICITYTILSVVGAIINEATGSNPGNLNNVFMFLFTTIAVIVLYLYKIFTKWSPLTVILVQYLSALALVLLLCVGVGALSHSKVNRYWEIVVSFSIPYWIGAAFFYIEVFRETKRQNELIKELQERAKRKCRGEF